MSEPKEMTHNQALQELTRFENIWNAASKLKEALAVAAAVEASVKRLQDEERRLEGIITTAKTTAETAVAESQQAIAQAKSKASATLDQLEKTVETRQAGYAEILAKEERHTQAKMEALDLQIGEARTNLGNEIKELEREAADKEATISSLNAQLESIRQRLGE